LSGSGFQNQTGATDETGMIKAYPIPVKRGANLNINLPVSSVSQVELISANGGIIGTYKLQGLSVIRTSNLVSGMYMLKIWNNSNLTIKKIIVN
jgi:hypothetical protein